MRRRSTLGCNGSIPVKLDTVIFPSDSRKVSVGPRCSSTVPDSKGPNLSNYCQPRGSNAGNSRQSVNNRQSVSNVKVQSQGMRRRLYGNGPDPSTSVLSGISMLGQSILESNEGPEEIPIPEAKEGGSSHKIVNTDTARVSLKLSESKLQKPKVYSVKKQQSASKFNTTAGFEEDEIAALTSTPRAGLDIGKRVAVVPNIDCTSVASSALVEQMTLLALDQRSAIQVMKLSFQKINSLLDKQSALVDKQSALVDKQSEMVSVQKNMYEKESELVSVQENLYQKHSELLSMQMKLFKEMKHHSLSASSHNNFQIPNTIGSKGMIESPESTTDTITDNEIIQILKKPNCDENHSVKEEVVSFNAENKENLSVSLPTSDSLYVNMRSQIKCLKTPTVHRANLLGSCAETPNTVLSNRVHNQLENLFETSETD